MLPARLNMLQLKPRRLPIAHPRTPPRRLLPVRRRLEILRPEGPRAALHRPRPIHHAPRIPRFVACEKRAVVVELLHQRVFVAHFSHKPPRELVKWYTQKISHPLHVLRRYPHISGRPGAAVATLRAFKSQALRVPHRLVNHRWRRRYRQGNAAGCLAQGAPGRKQKCTRCGLSLSHEELISERSGRPRQSAAGQRRRA